MLEKIKSWISWGLVFALAVMFAITLYKCDRAAKDNSHIVTIETHDTIKGDSIPYNIEVKKPYPVYRDTGSTKWKTMPVDSLRAITRDFYTKKYYDIKVKDDSSALIKIRGVVYMNSFDTLSCLYQNRRPTIINNTTTTIGEIPRTKVYIGGTVGKRLVVNSGTDIGVSALVATKKHLAFGVDYTINSLNYKEGTVWFTVLYKIGK